MSRISCSAEHFKKAREKQLEKLRIRELNLTSPCYCVKAISTRFFVENDTRFTPKATIVQWSGSQIFMVMALFKEILNTRELLLRILSRKSSENKKKSHHFKTVSEFFVFVSKYNKD